MVKIQDSISDQLGSILKRWQERLIDVSKSNPLLGLNRSRAARLEIKSPDLSNLTKTLFTDGASLKMPFVQKKPKRVLSTDEEVAPEVEEYVFHEGDIDFIFSNLGDLRKKLRKVFDSSQLTMNERGVNTLYLAMGCLEWEDALLGKSESPLIMIPCSLEFKGANKPMDLMMSDEDPVINPAIRYYLKGREKINISDIPEDFDFDKVNNFLESINAQVKASGWKVTKRAWLGIFSFETLAIYQDLKALDSQARNNTLVQAIAHLNGEPIENVGLDDKLDELKTPQIVPIPVVKADSSQLRAITLASQGANLVIHGPPGTGKSQTITAIIANALGQNKKVLFVSAKMAALNVVHNRLQEIGLGQYCLEAHGVKSGKRKVIDELKRSLETNDEIKIAGGIDEDISKLVESRNLLNEYVKVLHDSRNALSLSLFNAYGKFENLNDVPLVKAPLPWTDVLQVSSKELGRALEILGEVSDNADLFLRKDKHPLRGMRSGGVDLNTAENLADFLNKLISFCEILQEEFKKASFFEKIDISIPDLFASMQVFGLLAKVNDLPIDWYQKSTDELQVKLKEIVDCIATLESKNKFSEEFYSITSRSPKEVVEVISRYRETYPNWYSRLNLRFFEERKKCRAILDKVTNATNSILEEAIAKGQKLISMESQLALQLERLSSSGLNTRTATLENLSYLRHQYEAALAMKGWEEKQGASIVLVKKPFFDKKVSNIFTGLISILNSHKEELEGVQKAISTYWPQGLIEQSKMEISSIADLKKSAQIVLDSLNQAEIRNWQIISRVLVRCTDASLLPFLRKLDDANMPDAPGIFEKRFYSLWIDAAIHTKPILSEFSGDSQKNLISKFKILDEKVTRLTAINTIAEPAKIARQVKIANSIGGNSNGVGILRKEMEKKKRLKPLRVLFNEIPQVLQALKPCFLMSPLSVSTFLKPGAFNFDLVIFDEASQLPTPEAIPAILRAKQVIVAGDSNQLPPTSFFRTNIASDSDEWDEQQVEELESLLNDCKASVPFFQETDLKWHYRSRDEKLISFSNHYYYENSLITFPSPSTDNKKTGVVLEYVPDGVWDRGGSRINRKEARHVAKLIVKHFKTEPEKSLGVVSLNSSQKEAIEDALEEELQTQKDLMPLRDPERKEAFFVKSLENVQGDERDVIMISMGYGKAEDGKMSLNFGPINTEGGWRRLNVLVTRAKWKTVLVTSVRSSELIGINPENKGPVGLKNYIQYAETGYLNESRNPASLTGEETNDFEDSVRRELESRGFKVDAQIGVGSFKIDLAVRDPKNSTGYAIGIECDGASYHSSRSARDRDILRQEILEGMGWKLHRVWSTDWFRNREASADLLIENVNRAINHQTAKVTKKSESPDILSESDELTAVTFREKKAGLPYQKSRVRCRREMIMNPNKVNEFATTIASIVKEEGPILEDFLLDRIRELSKVGRIGANIQSNFECAIKVAIKAGAIETAKDDKGFLYDSYKKCTTFRVPGDDVRRQFYQISAIELQNAVEYLIKNQFGLAYDNMIQSLKPLFGIDRADPEENDRIKDLVDEMIARGLVVKHGPLLNLVTQI